jgi:DUF1680 family protein
LLDRDRRYTDVLEQALYNGVLSGIALDGSRFFYDNPLASDGSVHRQEWFGVACCPPNVARLLTSLGRYVYSAGPDELAVHLYVGSTATVALDGTSVQLRQRTAYPWDGDVVMEVSPEAPTTFAVLLRVPGWCAAPRLSVAGQPVDLGAVTEGGYARVEREWQRGDTLELSLPMEPRRVYADPRVRADAGRVALARGPLVYCAEAADNGPDVDLLRLGRDADLSATDVPSLPGMTALTFQAELPVTGDDDAGLYRGRPPATAQRQGVAIPYFAWDTREPGRMAVWLPERPG